MNENYHNAKVSPYFRIINENDLPEGPRESLRILRQSLETRQCEYCRRTGTLELEPAIYDDRSTIHYADGTQADEHTCYKVHAVCNAEHNTDYNRSDSTHVHCFYLNPHGKQGFSTGCGKTHRHGY